MNNQNQNNESSNNEKERTYDSDFFELTHPHIFMKVFFGVLFALFAYDFIKWILAGMGIAYLLS